MKYFYIGKGQREQDHSKEDEMFASLLLFLPEENGIFSVKQNVNYIFL